MSCNIFINEQSSNIFINEQSSLPASDRPTHEAKVKDPERQRRGKKSQETCMKKLKERFLEDNQEA